MSWPLSSVSEGRHLHAHPERSSPEHDTQPYLLAALEPERINEALSAAGTGIAFDVRGLAWTSNRMVAIKVASATLTIHEGTALS